MKGVNKRVRVCARACVACVSMLRACLLEKERVRVFLRSMNGSRFLFFFFFFHFTTFINNIQREREKRREKRNKRKKEIKAV